VKNGIVDIDYFSDILCVWAWIAQPRLEEMQSQWGRKIKIHHHFLDIFGDTEKKIPEKWGEENGFENFAAHVLHSAQLFEEAAVHEDAWTVTRPRSSAQAHLILRAAGLVDGEQTVASLALDIRRAFFIEARNVADMEVLLELAAQRRIDIAALEHTLRDGSAMASYSSDLRKAADGGVRGSPTWLLNEGRQVIYGNVGYRILNANIEELLNHPSEEASWC